MGGGGAQCLINDGRWMCGLQPISLHGGTRLFTMWGFLPSQTRGASDGLQTAYQGEDRQETKALHQV